jgi:SAM-dependent methyltransferase
VEGYYAGNLSGERLRQCYELASPRVRQYLDAEIAFVLDRLRSTDAALELGCGYGRVTFELGKRARSVVGIDTAEESLELARRLGEAHARCVFLEMDAAALTFGGDEFDLVACVQNGVCAFGVDPGQLIREAVRVTRPGGRVFFSTYSESFWPERLEWFEAQSSAGLLGEIDCDGTIVCKDGFRSGMLTAAQLHSLGAAAGIDPRITEVDGSSVFLELVVTGAS